MLTSVMPKDKQIRNRTTFNRKVNRKTEQLLNLLSSTSTLNYIPNSDNSTNDVQTSNVLTNTNNVNASFHTNKPRSINLNDANSNDRNTTQLDEALEIDLENNYTDTFSSLTVSSCLLHTSSPNIKSESITESTFQTTSESSDLIEINSKLATWAVEHKISNSALGALLGILKPYHTTLPTDPRTLLLTPRKILLKDVEPGKYFHCGIKQGLYYFCFLLLNTKSEVSFTNVNLQQNNICNVVINIDGLPISDSSSSQIYPILMSLHPHDNNVTIVGLYHGYEKPKCSNLFLRDFVEEAIFLTNHGFTFQNKYYLFKMKGFICDAPAKSFVKCVKGHTGYFSCTKCSQEREFFKNRMCFPDTDFVLRTHDEFLNQTQVEHHTLDYMHIHCLGIMKKMILLWLNGKPPFKLSAFKIAQISENLINQSINIPVEFCRKPRKLEEANRWKVTEFRQFLLYSGIIVLQGVLPRRYYGNFLALQLSTFILCNPDADKTQLIYAHSLNKYFVKTFKILYGIEHVVHNIHNLLHVVDDVRIFGSLDSYSAFPFENFLQTIKKIIRKPSCPIQQVTNRFFLKQMQPIQILYLG